MKTWNRVLTCLLAGMVAAGLGSACGDNERQVVSPPDPRPVLGRGLPPAVNHPAAAAIDAAQAAFVAGDHAGICAQITAAAAKQAGEAAHANPTNCKRDVRRLIRMVQQGGGWRHAGKPRVIAVERTGTSEAVATVALERRWQARVPVSRVNGRWKLSGFFGTSRGAAERVAKEIPDTAFPPAEGPPLEVIGSEDEPCPDLSEEDFPQIGGGCQIRLSGRLAPLTILTALGDFKFDDCALDYRVRIDSTGRTWTDSFDAVGLPQSEGCGDVQPCYDAATKQLVPWRGRIYADGKGGFVHRTAMCMRTCVGFFVGELAVRLSRDGDRWRARPMDGGGNSGLRFDNTLDIEGEIEIEPTGAS